VRIRSLLLAALVPGAALLASCDGSPSSSIDTPSVSFRYNGVFAGSFDVRAVRPAAGEPVAPYVDGVTPATDVVWVTSAQVNAGRREVLYIQAPLAPGEYAIGSCDGLPACPAIIGTFGLDRGLTNPVEGARQFFLDAGTITVLAPPRDGWVRGRFSGTAGIIVFSGGAWHPEGNLTITDGSFQADLVERSTGSY